LASAIGWILILKHRNRFDPRGGPPEGQVEANLQVIEPPTVTHQPKGFSTEGIVVLEFQLIGWVLIVLFFGAMVGSHKRTARH